jgi:D-alanine transaminase
LNNPVYLNGDYVPLSEAKISVLDRGFLFGDGVYEVIPWYQGRFLGFAAHIQRLNNSLKNINLDFSYSLEQWLQIFLPLMDNQRNQSIYLQITRGVAPKRDHLFPSNPQPTVLAICNEIPPFPDRALGVKAITLADQRWAWCQIKSTALLANVLLKQQAADQGASEAILIKHDYVTEGSASNIFAVIDGVLRTAPKTNAILAGITREIILDLAQQHHLPCAEQAISVAELKTASEIWLSSSTREIVPIVELDGVAVANGQAGAVWQQMHSWYQACKKHHD